MGWGTFIMGKGRKNSRRTPEEMTQLRTDLWVTCEKHRPVTVRGIFYLAVSAGIIEKTELSYKRIAALLGEMRKAGTLPYEWIVDHTRRSIGGDSPSSLAEYLEQSASLYRKNIWRDLPVHVEVWTEKETLTSVLLQETYKLGVGLYPTRGYPSLSFLNEAAVELERKDKPAQLYYFGDHDPTGLDIPRRVLQGLQGQLKDLDSQVKIEFKRLAVLPEQIEEWNLPTRPTKPDPRGKRFSEAGGTESVEVEAIPPERLRELCRTAILSHIPDGHLDTTHVAEASERRMIKIFASEASEASEDFSLWD